MSIFSKRSSVSTAPGKDICPHIGIAEDAQTCLAYPSDWNYCHHARPASAVSLEYQRSTCLLVAHKACPVFQSEQVKTLPADLRGKRVKLEPGKWALWLVPLALVLGFTLWWGLWRNSGMALHLPSDVPLQSLQTETLPAVDPAPTQQGIEMTGATPIFQQAVNLSPAPTPVSTATPTPPVTCGYELEDRIAASQQALVLHRVARGESMSLLAARYETSLPAIQAVNYFLPSPVWAGLVIVIPVESTTVKDLPVFEPYFILDPVASLEPLAAEFALDVEELIAHNDLDAGCTEYAGWLLIPHLAKKYP